MLPWKEVAEVTPATELHGQLSSFAGTTGVIGCLLVSLVGAALTADPPSKKPSKDAELETQRAKHRAATLAAGKERHQWLQELVGREWDMYDRDDYYYLLLVGSFGMSMQTVVMSTIVLTNLQAIPQSLAKKFVAKHHIWVAMPAIMIGPACLSLCAALCIALESEFGPKVSRAAWTVRPRALFVA